MRILVSRLLIVIILPLIIVLSGVFPATWFAPKNISPAISGSINKGSIRLPSFECSSLTWQRKTVTKWGLTANCLMGNIVTIVKPTLTGINLTLEPTSVSINPSTVRRIPLSATFIATIKDFSAIIGWDKQPKRVQGNVDIANAEILQNNDKKAIGDYTVQISSDIPKITAKFSNSKIDNPFGITATAEIFAEKTPYPFIIEGFVQRNDPSLLFTWLIPVSGQDTEQGSPIFHQSLISP
jgi:hypothetical protein